MIRKFLLPGLFLLLNNIVNAQAKIHSHNDYLQPKPFYDAITEKVYSIEADIFLKGDSLYVAHTEQEIKPGKTLEAMYLKPIQGFYDTPEFYNFQLVIDVKTDWTPTSAVLLKLLNKYKKILTAETKRVSVVISGNRPTEVAFRRYPEIISFDGLPGVNYSPPDVKRIAMISADFATYSKWNGVGEMPKEDQEKLLKVINEARQNRKPVRFWNAPDTPACWALLYQLGAHIINTDKIKESSDFLKKID